MDWGHWAVVAGAITAIIAVITNFLGILERLGSLLAKIRALFARRPAAPAGMPARTVVPIIQPRINALWWHIGRMGSLPGMQFCADFNVTNAWDRDIRLAGATLRVRHQIFSRKTVQGTADVKDLQSQYSGNYPIPPNEMTWVRAHFMYPEKKPPRVGDLIADVAIIDQFNNHHWVRGLRFKNTERMLQ